MIENPLLLTASRMVRAADLDGAEVVSEKFDAQHFGNGEVLFRLGTLLLRFVRDRGQDFLDIALAVYPNQFHQFDDVAIAMGWQSVDEVLGKVEPEPLGTALQRLREHLNELQAAIERMGASLTLLKIEEAARQRGDAQVLGLSKGRPII